MRTHSQITYFFCAIILVATVYNLKSILSLNDKPHFNVSKSHLTETKKPTIFCIIITYQANLGHHSQALGEF